MSSFADMDPSDPLRTNIRSRLAAGTLPTLTAGHRIYAGYGENQSCSGCGQRVGAGDVLYEVQLSQPTTSQPLALHLNCFAAWVLESHAGPISWRGSAGSTRAAEPEQATS